MDARFFHRRNLPHYHPPHGTFFITYRLAGSLPFAALEALRLESRRRDFADTSGTEKRATVKPLRSPVFSRYDKLLDAAETGPKHLLDPQIAQINAESIHYRDGKVFELVAFCIMPNHIHILFSVDDNSPLVSKIMQSLKRHTARESNNVLARSGPFWQAESFDRCVRTESEFERILHYILNNPVKAGLVEYWKDWPWTYCKYESL